MCTILAGAPGQALVPLQVEVDGIWRACDIVCDADDAVRPVECQVAVRTSRGASVFTLRGANGIHTAVPVGMCMFELHSVGYETQVVEEDVVANRAGHSLKVTFTVGRR